MTCRYKALAVLLALLLTGVNSCTSSNGTNHTLATRAPLQITPANLAQLHWIEGDWRGTGGGVPPFYERYKFENESTLTVETFADETLTKVNDVSRFELKDGKFGHSDGKSGSVATVLDSNSITFDPVGKGNSFRWQRESENSWKAILTWTENGVAKERVYNMERWPAATR
jgi:hypothetical protein